jgi:hypothetical protein
MTCRRAPERREEGPVLSTVYSRTNCIHKNILFTVSLVLVLVAASN